MLHDLPDDGGPFGTDRLDICDICPNSIECGRPLIPHVRGGASVRFDVTQVEAWIRAGGTALDRDDT